MKSEGKRGKAREGGGREGKQGKVGEERERKGRWGSEGKRCSSADGNYSPPFWGGAGGEAVFPSPSPYGSPSCSTMALTCRGVKVLFDVW